MKKLLIIIGLFISVGSFAQDLAWDSLDHVQTTADADYGLVLSGSPGSEVIKGMTMQYLQPWVWGAGYLRPRYTTTKLILGTSSDYPYTFYNAGDSYLYGTVRTPTGTRVYFGNSYVTEILGSLSFYDANVGVKTLTDLATSGAGVIDTTGLPTAGRVAVFTSSTHIGNGTNVAEIRLINSRAYGFSITGTDDDVTLLSNGIVSLTGKTANMYFTGTSDFTGDLRMNGELTFNERISLNYLNLATADTCALIVKGNSEWVDTASLVSAAAGWQAKLGNYFSFYRQSKDYKALPLPYPDGTERREFNEMYKNYQTEFELERIHRYMFRMWIENKAQWLLILLLGFGLYKVRK